MTLINVYSLGEFGIVYRATLGPHGRSGQEVAVKTLKGRNVHWCRLAFFYIYDLMGRNHRLRL